MRRKVERLVGSHYSSAVPGFGPKSFPRGRRGSHRSCGGSIGRAVAIYSEPTSRVTVAPLAARKVDPLVRRFIIIVVSSGRLLRRYRLRKVKGKARSLMLAYQMKAKAPKRQFRRGR